MSREGPIEVGVLALQGDFAAHERALRDVADESELVLRRVRRGPQLDDLDALVLPGGESTTFLKLLSLQGLDEAIPAFARAGGVVFGTCAGAIVLATTVTHPAQASLGLLDASIERNAYGRQIDSFVERVQVEPEARAALGETLEAVFIRAPRFASTGPGVEILARAGADPVLVREGNVLAATFHPELSPGGAVHRLLIDTCRARRAGRSAVGASVAEPVAGRSARAD